jgi:hypothetical protein
LCRRLETPATRFKNGHCASALRPLLTARVALGELDRRRSVAVRAELTVELFRLGEQLLRVLAELQLLEPRGVGAGQVGGPDSPAAALLPAERLLDDPARVVRERAAELAALLLGLGDREFWFIAITDAAIVD